MLVLLGDEGLGADGLLTAAADEAGLVPRGAAVLQLPGSWRRGGGFSGQDISKQQQRGYNSHWRLSRDVTHI